MPAQPSLCISLRAALAAACVGLAGVTSVEARVTRIVVDTTTSPAFAGASFGTVGQYETIAGRAFGELDPSDPHNTIITDIALAPRNANGKVEYMATFFLVKPINMAQSSHLLWQDVPNRGGRITIGVAERNGGDIGLSSGWQGDNSGATAQTPAPGNTNDYAVVPVARNPDGSTITGPVIGRIFNVSGVNSQPMIVYTNPVPYVPASLDTTQATLITHTAETNDGVVVGESTVPSGDWAFASCSAANPFPGTPDPTKICLRNGFNPALAYYVKFMAKDPYVLGIGFAAFRDMGLFFKNQAQDDFGTPNPLAGNVRWAISRGASQSGNFLRAYLDLGFNQDEAGRQVHDGSWPTIAGGRLALNVRFGVPDNAARFYDAGRDGPTWWTRWPDPVRGLPTKGILDRCLATGTCPKIVETFGATELWYLRMNQSMVGAAADADIPLNRNIRRYYIAGTTHGGGNGGFSETPPAVPSGSGTNWGQCTLNGNPLPHTETRAALQDGLRKWIMSGTPMVPSRYPTLVGQNLVEPTKQAIGFPTIPGLPASAPEGLVTPVIDYDFGPRFSKSDESGIVDMMPSGIGIVLKTVVPRVDADGNEVGGVPAVLHDAPLGTYTGWNITAAGFYKDRICSFTGGMIPFAKTKAQRLASGDPRLSLEERYGSHAGYVAAVQTAANNAFNQGFLLDADRTALIAAAQASNVCAHGASGQSCDPAAP